MSSEKNEKPDEEMSPIVEYIQTLPVSGATKWFAAMMAYSQRRIFTQQWLVRHTSYEKRTVRHFLYQLMDCGMVHKRQEGNEHRYYIGDIRLIHHMAAEKKGFKPEPLMKTDEE